MTQLVFIKYNTSCLFLLTANDFQFSEMGTSPCNICNLCNVFNIFDAISLDQEFNIGKKLELN